MDLSPLIVPPAYDLAGNMIRTPPPATPTSTFEAVYDAWNRLISLASGGTLVATNGYDGASRRASLDSGSRHHFYYSRAWQLLEERLGALPIADRQFVWGLQYVDCLLLRDRADERYYAIRDDHRGVTAIVATSGIPTERYSYAPYGQPTFRDGSFAALDGSGVGWESLYSGYSYETETGLLLARHRFLNPSLGVWLTADPLGAKQFAMNLYCYVGGQPLTSVDPTGLYPGRDAAAAPNDIDPPYLEYTDCDDKEKEAIEKELEKILKKYKECLKDTGLEKCFETILDPKGRWVFSCVDCKKDKKKDDGNGGDICGSTEPERDNGPCKASTFELISSKKRRITLCKPLGGAGCGLLETLMHELIHNCGVDHGDNNEGALEGCSKKCFNVGTGDAAECKCRKPDSCAK